MTQSPTGATPHIPVPIPTNKRTRSIDKTQFEHLRFYTKDSCLVPPVRKKERKQQPYDKVNGNTKASLDLNLTSICPVDGVPLIVADASILNKPVPTNVPGKQKDKNKKILEEHMNDVNAAYYRELTRLIPLEIRQARYNASPKVAKAREDTVGNDTKFKSWLKELKKDSKLSETTLLDWPQWMKQQSERHHHQFQLKSTTTTMKAEQGLEEIPPEDYLVDPISILDNSVAYIEFLQEQLVQGRKDSVDTREQYRQVELDWATRALRWRRKLEAEEKEHARLTLSSTRSYQ